MSSKFVVHRHPSVIPHKGIVVVPVYEEASISLGPIAARNQILNISVRNEGIEDIVRCCLFVALDCIVACLYDLAVVSSSNI